MASTACSDTGDAKLDTKRASLIGAAEDATNTWSVGVCQGTLTSDVDAGRNGVCRGCSGTLVAPNLVLTARHCLRTATDRDATGHYCSSTFTNDDVSPGGTRITTSATTREGTPVWYEAKEVLVPASNKMCEDDLALVVLDENVPAAEAKPVAVDVWRDLSAAKPSTVAIVGRGYTAAHHGPADAAPDASYAFESADVGKGLRRKVENAPFHCIGTGSPACVLRDHTDPGFPGFDFVVPTGLFKTGARAVYGDSGSGVFDQATFGTSQRAVIGVFTYFSVEDSGDSLNEVSVRVDAHRSFLIAGATTAAAAGAYAVPDWTKKPETPKPDAGPGSVDSGADAASRTDDDAGAAPSPGAAPPADDSGGCAAAGRPREGFAISALAIAALAFARRRRKASPPRVD